MVPYSVHMYLVLSMGLCQNTHMHFVYTLKTDELVTIVTVH